MGIEFNNDLKTGIEEIDSQHQFLFEAINKLVSEKPRKDNIWDVLLDIQKYACIHFDTEESYMAKFQYPAKEHHTKEHAKFLAKFSELKVLFNESGFSKIFVGELQDFLIDWILTHYQNTDREMAFYLKQKINLIQKK